MPNRVGRPPTLLSSLLSCVKYNFMSVGVRMSNTDTPARPDSTERRTCGLSGASSKACARASTK
eukprot:14225952-Alexandrium_andersonii.AAC.1